jgi:hypothetical protein
MCLPMVTHMWSSYLSIHDRLVECCVLDKTACVVTIGLLARYLKTRERLATACAHGGHDSESIGGRWIDGGRWRKR